MRGRRLRRHHGGGLTDPTGVVRPAVEAALEVARAWSSAGRRAEVPQGLRVHLGFTKLSPGALRAIAKAVDGDEAFRLEVAGAVSEADVGRAGWLWLHRPDGWEDEAQLLEDEAAAAAVAAVEERDERSARRRLAAAREAAERATARVDAQAEQIRRLRTDLSDERARRSSAEHQVEEVTAELRALREERNRAVRELKEAEARLADRVAELRALKEADAEAGLGDRVAEPDQRRAAPSAEGPDGLDRAALSEALASAAADAGALGAALTRLRSLLDAAAGRAGAAGGGAGAAGRSSAGAGTDGTPVIGAAVSETDRGQGLADGGEPGSSRRWESPLPSAERVPVRLPGGVISDSPEATDHLLRVPNVLVLVDGYNVTLETWPDRPLAEQRTRLVKGLDAIAASYGIEAEVIFDGVEADDQPGSWARRPDVRTRFSPPDVEADEVLLDLLAEIPPARPVVVVSSDREVRRAARRLGANLLHARQLRTLLTHP